MLKTATFASLLAFGARRNRLNGFSVGYSSLNHLENISKRCIDNAFCNSFNESTSMITLVSKDHYNDWKSNLSYNQMAWLETISKSNVSKFPGKSLHKFPTNEGLVSHVLFFDEFEVKQKGFKTFDGMFKELVSSQVTYEISYFKTSLEMKLVDEAVALAWGMACYRFDFFKSRNSKQNNAKLLWPPRCDQDSILGCMRSYYLIKDLVDTPALYLGPQQFSELAQALLQECKMEVKTIRGGKNLETANFCQIAAVGMGSPEERAPVLVDATWSPSGTFDKSISSIVIIGKGVVFDTGGLNLKPGNSMKTMKKDMAGAAQALALARWIVDSKLPVNLRVMLPMVENAISGASLRPGDVITAKNGITTEITNTDAEGRLILADCLAAAVEVPTMSALTNPPDLIVDFATLTGAARTALGTDVPALFSNKMTEGRKLEALSQRINDPLWMLPLYLPMKKSMKSNVADLVNSVEGQGGAILAALYLHEFLKPWSSDSSIQQLLQEQSNEIKSSPKNLYHDFADEENAITWFHIDFMGLKNNVAEPQGLRAVYEYIRHLI